MKTKSFWYGVNEVETHYERDTTKEVIEEEKNTFTGLYDAKGQPLHRSKERIGFKLK